MAPPNNHNAHAKPPTTIREEYKRLQKLDKASLSDDGAIIDVANPAIDSRLRLLPSSPSDQPENLNSIFAGFLQGSSRLEDGHSDIGSTLDLQLSHAYEVPTIPGTSANGFIRAFAEVTLLERLFHRDLSDPSHKTNIHTHFEVPYPPDDGKSISFFGHTMAEATFAPRDPTVHRPFTSSQFLNKKLRWMTLGGQYDWTRKVYPDSPPPPFPEDVKALVEGLFPMKAEAAIVNLYSPGDTLSLHRDVSEQCNQPLSSISIGCDCLFIVGLQDTGNDGETRMATLRLRSGDAVLMSGASRYAWHGVPKVLEGTCPEWLQHWPGEEYGNWKGWMKTRRININVRQMYE